MRLAPPFAALTLAALGLAAAPPQAAQAQQSAIQAQQSLYVSTNSSIEKITPAGTASTFYSGSGLLNPIGLAFDSGGNLFAANSGNSSIEKITIAFGTATSVSTYATDPNGATFLAFGPNTVSAAPEPSEWAALGFTTLGIGGLLLKARRRKAA